MSPLVARTVMTVVLVALGLGVTALGLRAAFPVFWRRHGRRLVVGTLLLTVLLAVGWRGRSTFGTPAGHAWFFLAGMTSILVSSVALFVSAPVWGTFGIWTRRLVECPAPAPAAAPSRPSLAGDGVDLGRRHFLRGASGALPAAVAVTGPAGAVAASLRPVLREVEVTSRQVPAGLDGFTILQLTDIHLGAFIGPEQLRAVVDVVRACGVQPDCVVLTGDICDDYPQLPPALAELARLAPPHGVHACIGNHEIYRGRAEAERIYAEAGVGFWCNSGTLLEKNGARLWLAGADDPARGLDGSDVFLRQTIQRALAACPSDVTCRVLLSHRPRGFVAAAEAGVTLTLSGHTHGAQMALFGRSLLEPFWPESFLLGLYRRGDSALYTSAGLGHWFPFRLNCPCEVALVTLRAGAAPPATT